jgi:hypothetical protein
MSARKSISLDVVQSCIKINHHAVGYSTCSVLGYGISFPSRHVCTNPSPDTVNNGQERRNCQRSKMNRRHVFRDCFSCLLQYHYEYRFRRLCPIPPRSCIYILPSGTQRDKPDNAGGPQSTTWSESQSRPSHRTPTPSLHPHLPTSHSKKQRSTSLISYKVERARHSF